MSYTWLLAQLKDRKDLFHLDRETIYDPGIIRVLVEDIVLHCRDLLLGFVRLRHDAVVQVLAVERR